jgi:glycosyltransferase involved in cell wall biosynthesis
MEKHEANSPLVSVVIPVYNVEAYLRECVDSVLGQTLGDFEIILVDDGATDSSGRICDEYAAKHPKVRVIHQENGGLSAARNTGLDAAGGEYVYFLDSDDYIVPHALERLCDLARKEQVDVVFFDASVFFTDCEPDPKVYRYERSRQYPAKNGRQMLLELLDTDEYRTAVPLMLFRRDYMSKHDLRFRSGILHEDELFTFYVYHGDGLIAHCHEQLYARRMRPASIMTGASLTRRYESMYAIYFELSGLYRSRVASDEAGRRYLARISRSVLAKYKHLPEEERAKKEAMHKAFCKDVLRNDGYRDGKLKIKCSTGIRRLLYRAELKIHNMLG